METYKGYEISKEWHCFGPKTYSFETAFGQLVEAISLAVIKEFIDVIEDANESEKY